ncbi:MAG TPA: hypothetical protein VMX14_13275 [Anaerolineae bacterium]|nr:hypothetical protein [Anaerolineae bacterium]
MNKDTKLALVALAIVTAALIALAITPLIAPTPTPTFNGPSLDVDGHTIDSPGTTTIISPHDMEPRPE